MQNVQSVFQLLKMIFFNLASEKKTLSRVDLNCKVECCEKLVREMSNLRLDFPSQFPQEGRQQQFARTSL